MARSVVQRRHSELSFLVLLAVVAVAVGLVEGLGWVVDPSSEGVVVVLLKDLTSGACDILRIWRDVIDLPYTSEVIPHMPCVNELCA